MLVVGYSPEPSGEPPLHLRQLLQLGVSGVILFARNLTDPGQAPSQSATLKSLGSGCAGQGLLLCVDQEGGRVARLRGSFQSPTGTHTFTAVPAMRAIGRAEESGISGVARAAGRVLAAETRWAGFDVNFAPVVDVDTNPANPVIGSRSFSRDPLSVSRLATEFIQTMQSPGPFEVAACAKHFPGHGDTSLDSHKALPSLPHSLDRLRDVELPPFQAAVRAGVAGVMSAHVLFNAVDPHFPATMSPAALGHILRDQMHFDGVIFSDDLEMKAMTDHYALEDQLIRGLAAGIGLFLICHTPDLQWRAIDILAREIDAGRVPDLKSSRSRVTALARRFARMPSTHDSLSQLQQRLTPERNLLQEVRDRFGELGEADPTAYKK